MDELLSATAALASEYLAGAGARPVARPVTLGEMVAAIDSTLPDEGVDPLDVVRDLARNVDPGLVLTNGGRYFGFVEGGVLPAALAADWLASTWDQNPGFFALSPAAAAVEEICRGWLCDLLGLPDTWSAGFTTGAQLANFAGLAAARHHVLTEAGWDLEKRGLFGAPPVTVVVGRERHATIDRALRFLGIGSDQLAVVDVDDQGRMRADGLRLGGGPTIVCAQAGNVNTGAVDPLASICEQAHAAGAWVHVDGAFGAWAAASPALRHLTDGLEQADSLATDGHKWLNVPYDCGVVLCARPDAHRAAMRLSADYLVRDGERHGSDWTPESSRRARAFAVYAALRSLGRRGVARLVETSCAQARRIAERLPDHIEVLNTVTLNQVLVRIGNDDERTRRAAAAIQRGGATWLGTTTWQGWVAIRISVSDHATDDAALETLVQALAEN
ncbi:pyridoxal phosphate-dependent decarboxylase family protein [Cryptosporangium aurantiacum]|uniref:Glutamate or tyrosine decarboxylase n=1 Tax=Cryptosporangium aurantiacum TaxID=134849 RepID=A0A1M7PRX0_9ACTN|nr:aminotransferase class V-fold PLP-dependent enzyme [Cryptosporangium aurantiacum]SHN20178.1 Glutamate or tyrosine decarboxylase [Cryptosporangium aurantiacum]